MIIGGGSCRYGGARVAKLRGHQVTLYEMTDKLGGHLIEACVPDFKDDDKRLLKWYENEMKILNINVKLDTEVTLDMVKENPDAVIIATGSNPVTPDSPGINLDNVVVQAICSSGKRR